MFVDTLKDIYFAEKQILKALPRMARAAQSEEGKVGFLKGIIAESEEIIEEFKGSAALDAGLISAAQAVEHYEIDLYGTLIAWAKQLGLKDAIPLLQASLAEEEGLI
ncbi:DUF892 family protein [Rhizobium sp. 007]|uniref:YciE/YciF ferroxidase family protein n=1 Tax=Rhizobium sp. 007 TaxID=2785056 RepID=UPI00188E6F59|nr:DUF892 family protein [Rhizobium sp. 007]QPB24160.1 ferritin-like domain-containing protein [Rhizobium sp. 007]